MCKFTRLMCVECEFKESGFKYEPCTKILQEVFIPVFENTSQMPNGQINSLAPSCNNVGYSTNLQDFMDMLCGEHSIQKELIERKKVIQSEPGMSAEKKGLPEAQKEKIEEKVEKRMLQHNWQADIDRKKLADEQARGPDAFKEQRVTTTAAKCRGCARALGKNTIHFQFGDHIVSAILDQWKDGRRGRELSTAKPRIAVEYDWVEKIGAGGICTGQTVACVPIAPQEIND